MVHLANSAPAPQPFRSLVMRNLEKAGEDGLFAFCAVVFSISTFPDKSIWRLPRVRTKPAGFVFCPVLLQVCLRGFDCILDVFFCLFGVCRPEVGEVCALWMG